MDLDREEQELDLAISKIWEIASGFGLDPFTIHFEMVPAHIMYEFGAYGLPSRFSHWTHGRAYQELKTMYDYGLNKIYELVINTDPCHAFLLESNSVLQNKLVVAHVLAHSDFFKTNAYFQQTNRDMLERAAINAERIHTYEYIHGRLEVERFLDAVLAIQEHVDPNQIVRSQRDRHQSAPVAPLGARRRRAGSAYDDLFSSDELTAQRVAVPTKRLVEPETDMLLFLTEHAAQLTDWQRDIVGIVRSETLYFIPQMRTKIMNEGWASLWHARIMRELDLPVDQAIEFARLHANVLAPSGNQINPYLVGMHIFEDIERRWDNPTAEERDRLGREPGQGRAKIFEVRETESDVSFLRNYLTKDLVEELQIHVSKPGEGEEEGKEEDPGWEEVRDFLVNSMVNFGHPLLEVQDGNYAGKGELYIKHVFDGKELDLKYAERTAPYVHQLWGKPVHIETILEEKPCLLTWDGGPDGLKNEPL